MHKIAVIIVAGGSATRFHGTTHKLLLSLHHRSILEQSLLLFENHPKIAFMVLVVHPSLEPFINTEQYAKLQVITEGGRNRQESVFLGLSKVLELSAAALPDYVLIHDAARPNATPKLIDRLLMELPSYQGVVPVIPLYDSLKSIENELILSVSASPSWHRTQTPQVFCFDLLYQNSLRARELSKEFRDETDLVLSLSPETKIKAIHGEFCNEKLTSLEQVEYMQKLSPYEVKSGIGYDFHYFQECRPLILGGVPIPFEYGLEGDSDGDVLTHAILEAMLGALSLGDMGTYFGIGSPDLMGITSTELFHRLFQNCHSLHRDFSIIHIDTTLVAKKPPLTLHVENIKHNLATCLNINKAKINIKATSDKGMDAAGSGKGIRAIALVTLSLAQEAIHE